MTTPRHLLLWDGKCGFCRRSVEWVRRHDREGRFEIIPFQDAPAPPMTPELGEACKRAVHVITSEGRVLRAGRASMFVLRETGHPLLGRVLATPPLVWLVELGYVIVARNRSGFSWILGKVSPPGRAGS
jgi:predicted DCC family thiol-disulfide oxidoreductase YuxK